MCQELAIYRFTDGCLMSAYTEHYLDIKFPLTATPSQKKLRTQKNYFKKMVSVLLFALVKRFSVSRTQDFFFLIFIYFFI